jgi:hypothetical protein
MRKGLLSVLSKSLRLAIVGGTGDYGGARGWQNTTWLDSKFSKARVT